jgi:hypothetical protein
MFDEVDTHKYNDFQQRIRAISVHNMKPYVGNMDYDYGSTHS